MSDYTYDPVALFEARQDVGPAPTPALTDQERQAAIASLPAHSSSGRMSIGPDGTTTDHQTASYNAIQDRPDGSTGVVASGHTQGGFSTRSASQLQPDDMVILPNGVATLVSVAEQLGFIEKDQHGVWRDVASSPDWNEREKPPEAREEKNEALDSPDADRTLTAVCEKLDTGTQVRGMLQLIETGEMKPHTLNEAATAMGMSAREFQGQLAGVLDAFDRQARQAVGRAGVEDADEFFSWADTHHKGAFVEARRRHGMGRTTAGYAGLVKSFMATRGRGNQDGVIASVRAAGASARRTSDGDVLVRLPNGMETTYEAAVRAGFLRGA